MSLFYDIIIFGFLIADGWLFIRFIKNWRVHFGSKARKLLSAVLLTGYLLSWLVVFYGSFIEPKFLVVKNHRITLSETDTTTLRMALISDLHVGPYKKAAFVEKIVAKTMALKPDIVVVAGDFVFNDKKQVEYLSPLKNLRPPLGVFAVLGNHDYKERIGASGDGYFDLDDEDQLRADAVRNKLTSLGISVLINQGARIEFGNKTLAILGTDELWTRRANIEKTFISLGLTSMPFPSILISHNPDIVLEAKKENIPLVLSGHTHAGQIRLPWIGSIIGLPDKLGRKYDKGLFRFNGTQLFITSGVGEIGARARLFNPPKIDVLEISL